MTGFFTLMGARANGTETRLRLRRPEPYETAALVGLPDVPIANAPSSPALSSRPSRGREPIAGTPASETITPVGLPHSPHPDAGPAPDVHRKARPAPPPGAAGPSPEADAVAPSPWPDTALRGPNRGIRTETGRTEATVRPEPPSPAGPPGPVAGRPSVPDRPSAAEPPVLVPAAPIDLSSLLRVHVLPALTVRGVVGKDETPVLAEGPTPERDDAPAPGTVTVRPVGVRLPPAGPVPSAPRTAKHAHQAPSSSVHVHIGQIVVTKAPPAPAPMPLPPRPSLSTDHAAYLARREGGR